jgi:hypothetical protein
VGACVRHSTCGRRTLARARQPSPFHAARLPALQAPSSKHSASPHKPTLLRYLSTVDAVGLQATAHTHTHIYMTSRVSAASVFTFWPARVHRADDPARIRGCSHVLGEVPREILALGAVYASDDADGASRLRVLSNVARATALCAQHELVLARHAPNTLATCPHRASIAPHRHLACSHPCIAAGNRPDALDMRSTRGKQACLKGSTVGARGALLAAAVGPRHGCCVRARERRARCARLIPCLDLVGAGAARHARLSGIPWECVRVESTHAWEVCPNPNMQGIIRAAASSEQQHVIEMLPFLVNGRAQD